MKEYITHSATETLALGKSLADTLLGGEVVLLTGDLGAGKTTFSKGVALGLGVCETVTSPTFTLMNEYTSGRLPLYHFDMYRLPLGSDVEMGFDEYYGTGKGVCLIEWSAAEEYFNARVISVCFEYLSGESRRITIDCRCVD